MCEVGEGLHKPLLIPAGVSCWPEEVGAEIIVNPEYGVSLGSKTRHDLSTNQAR